MNARYDKAPARKVGVLNQTDACTGTKRGNRIGLDVELMGPLSAFGEMLNAPISPRVQIDAIYGLRSKTDTISYTTNSGVVSEFDGTTGREFRANCGTTNNSIAQILSRRKIRYRPGQGTDARFTGRFDSPATSNSMRVGLLNIGNELTFGYDTNTTFGIFHKRGGRPEIQRLFLQTTTGNEVSTINLDGTSYNVTLTTGGPTHGAYEIAQATYTGWDAFANSTSVYFVAKDTGDKTGTFNFTTTGTMVADFTVTANGVSETVNFYSQSAWNVNAVNTSTAPFILNPQNGNVYQVVHQYLGYGQIRFYIEEPISGSFLNVHNINYANSNSSPSMDIPIYGLGAISENFGSNTATSVYTASLFGGVQGQLAPLRNPDSHKNSLGNITATATNIISLRVSRVFENRINLSEVLPLNADFAVEGTKPNEIGVLLNAEISGEPNWQYHSSTHGDGENQGVSEIADNAFTVSVGANTIELFNAALAKSDSKNIPLQDFRINLKAGDVLTLFARNTVSVAMDVTGALTWLED